MEEIELQAQSLTLSVEKLSGKLQKQIEDYKHFAFKDNIAKMAVAFILGGVSVKFIGSLSENIVMPVVKWLLAFADNSWRDMTWIPVQGMIIETGKFAAAFIDFIVTSVTLFVVWKFLMSWQFVEPETAKPLEQEPKNEIHRSARSKNRRGRR